MPKKEAKELDSLPRITPRNRQDWREWLITNHDTAKGVWVVLYKQHSGKKQFSYEEAVEEALSFGWIDSRANKLDQDSYLQKFGPRQPKSTWARSNKMRVDKLIAAGLMTPAGLKVIEEAKRNGSWDSQDENPKSQTNSEYQTK